MLTITNNNPVDYYGNPIVTEGETIQWKIVSSNPALGETVQIAPSSPNISGGAQLVNFAPGTSNTQFVSFSTIDDKIYEPFETYSFGFRPSNGTALNTTFASGTLRNNDRLPEITITAQKATLLENVADPAFHFDVVRSGEDLSMVTTVEVKFAPTGITPVSQADLVTPLGSQFVRFEVGETQKTLDMVFRNDTEIEATETLEASIVSATSTSPTQYWSSPQYNPVTKYSAAVAILNDDGMGGPSPLPPSNPPPIDVYRFYNTVTQAHFFTPSASERDIIQGTLPDFRYEGVGFKAVVEQPNADPIFRFYNAETQTHFFTPSVTERDAVINGGLLRYEGVGFYGSDHDGGGMTEVYRFYNMNTGVHFYTPSVLERNTIQDTLPNFRYEGIGFYVPDASSYDLIG
ncbi:MAG: hypothetical protein EOP21_01850 [Hyphomicrobiales bacterium]|nr:MAG: hypothetical protein EOP21_01850 [Hyphomicrobiales bacterium]